MINKDFINLQTNPHTHTSYTSQPSTVLAKTNRN